MHYTLTTALLPKRTSWLKFNNSILHLNILASKLKSCYYNLNCLEKYFPLKSKLFNRTNQKLVHALNGKAIVWTFEYSTYVPKFYFRNIFMFTASTTISQEVKSSLKSTQLNYVHTTPFLTVKQIAMQKNSYEKISASAQYIPGRVSDDPRHRITSEGRIFGYGQAQNFLERRLQNKRQTQRT